LTALTRATAVVISRAELDTAGIERLIRAYNSDIPIFRSRVVTRDWDAGLRRVGAICGIGSPRSFWRTLRMAGLVVVWKRAFSDHHVYSAQELDAAAREAAACGAEALVTTEKDLMNISEFSRVEAPRLKLVCLKIGLEIENEDQLLARLR
jgi:tetraacyldisaccharide 4'-kinase